MHWIPTDITKLSFGETYWVTGTTEAGGRWFRQCTFLPWPEPDSTSDPGIFLDADLDPVYWPDYVSSTAIVPSTYLPP